jgi:ribosomal protein S14
MFVGDEVQLQVGFAIARERLRQLAEGGALLGTSEDAYDHGTTGLERVGVPGLSRLVRVQVRELASTDQSVGLAIRWEATGPSGGLFPVLDADLTMASVEERVTILTLAGAYRPPLGTVGAALDRAVLHRVASATIRAFLAQVARRITGQPATNGAGTGPPPEGTSLP